MLPFDVWTAVIHNMHCTESLLKLRLVNKAIKDQIPIHMITGVSMDLMHLFCDPVTTQHGSIRMSDHEDIEGTLTDEGSKFRSWVYSDPIRITEYSANDSLFSEKNTTFTTLPHPDTILWLKITTTGLMCMVSTSFNDKEDDPLLLSVMRLSEGVEESETIIISHIDREFIMRHSVFQDEPDEYTFSRSNLYCFTWNKRTFISMVPLHKEGYVILMEVKDTDIKWVSWQIQCEGSRCIGCVRQVKNKVYFLTVHAQCVFVMDLDDPSPAPSIFKILPGIPKSINRYQSPIASMLDVSDNGEHFLVHVNRLQSIFHVTSSTVRSLEPRLKLNFNGFSVIGNQAAVCFIRNSREYRLYNLKTKSLVRKFQFEFIPRFSLMGIDSIWSIGPLMSVHRHARRFTTRS
jgi:hypothetical protein